MKKLMPDPEETKFEKVDQYTDGLRDTAIDELLNADDNLTAVKNYLDKVIDVEAEVGIGAGGTMSLGPAALEIGGKSIYGVADENGNIDLKSGGTIGVDVLGSKIGFELVYNWTDNKFENVIGMEQLKVGEFLKLEFGIGGYFVYGGEGKLSVDLYELLRPLIDQYNKYNECDSSK